MVCQECGLNVQLLGVHTPGCSRYEQNEVTAMLESQEVAEATGPILSLVEAAKDRTALNMESMIKYEVQQLGLGGSVLETIAIAELRKELEKNKPLMDAAAFLGASNLLTILIEQNILDEDAVRKFIADSTL